MGCAHPNGKIDGYGLALAVRRRMLIQGYEHGTEAHFLDGLGPADYDHGNGTLTVHQMLTTA